MDSAERTREAAYQAHTAVVDMARQFPAIFTSYILRDEFTGAAIECAPYQDEWQDIITKNRRVVIWGSVESGKTQQISIARVLWEIGNNPNIRVAVISNTANQAKKIVRTISQYIQKSPELREVFPGLRPTRDPALSWTAVAITVDRAVIAKDPTVQACGVHGNITGSRLDLIILDDILDHENTRSERQRAEVYRWIRSTPLSRLTKDSRVVVIGNAWHPDDVLHKLASEAGYFSKSYPVEYPDGTLSWPTRWPKNRIEEAKLDLGPLESARQLYCRARDEASSRFKMVWIEKCLERGKDFSLVPGGLGEDKKAYNIITGIDLGIGRTKGSDFTVYCTVCLWPTGERQLISLIAARQSGPDIISTIETLHDRFGGIFIVESNQAQMYIVDFASQAISSIVFPFHTGTNKHHPVFGVEGIGIEMSNGEWVIPCLTTQEDGLVIVRSTDQRRSYWVTPNVAQLIQDALFFMPGSHTGDHLMAAWFSREGCRMQSGRHRAGVKATSIVGSS